MVDQFQPAQPVNVTIARVPQREDARQTIRRLMRLDPDIKRALRQAQSHRRRTTRVRTRSGRPWRVRQSAAQVARVEQGASWTMPFYPQIVDDLRSVEPYLEIKAG